LVLLTLVDAQALLKWSTTIYNFAIGFSCFHVLIVNTTLLPMPLRPNWLIRIGLVLGGMFFMSISLLSLLAQLEVLK
jgi:hypothetical protein